MLGSKKLKSADKFYPESRALVNLQELVMAKHVIDPRKKKTWRWPLLSTLIAHDVGLLLLCEIFYTRTISIS